MIFVITGCKNELVDIGEKSDKLIKNEGIINYDENPYLTELLDLVMV